MAWSPSRDDITGNYYSQGSNSQLFNTSGWTKLDPSRDWKTTWDNRGKFQAYHVADQRYLPRDYLNLTHTNQNRNKANYAWNMIDAGGGKPVYGTGATRKLYQYDSGEYEWDEYGYNMERLDFGAYDRDPWYKQGFEGLGRTGGFTTLQDIYDAEQWHKDGITDAQRAEQAAWERERDDALRRNELLQEQLANAQKPRQIDVGQGQTIGEGGVADYVLGLEQQRARELDALTQQLSGQYNTQLSDARSSWQQQSASDLDALTQRLQQQYGTQISDAERNAELQRQQMGQQLRSEYDQKLQQAQAGWTTESQQERDALTQQLTDQYRTEYDKKLADAQAKWQSASATQERAYDARISDLTAGWDTQRSAYDSSLSNLTSQLGQQKSAYDTQISGLSTQLGQQQEAYGALTSEFAQQRQDWSKQQAEWGAQRTAYDTSLSNLNKSISDYQARDQKRLKEAATESQRARTAAAYASQGGPVNPSVGGVKTQRGLTDARRNRYGTSFKRADMTITNKQLNI